MDQNRHVVRSEVRNDGKQWSWPNPGSDHFRLSDGISLQEKQGFLKSEKMFRCNKQRVSPCWFISVEMEMTITYIYIYTDERESVQKETDVCRSFHVSLCVHVHHAGAPLLPARFIHYSQLRIDWELRYISSPSQEDGQVRGMSCTSRPNRGLHDLTPSCAWGVRV